MSAPTTFGALAMGNNAITTRQAQRLIAAGWTPPTPTNEETYP